MDSSTANSGPITGRRAWFPAAVLLLACAQSCVASAVEAVSTREISREQAAQELQKRYGNSARVVRTDVTEESGHHVYVFRLLSVTGRVWVVRIDAQSGAEVP